MTKEGEMTREEFDALERVFFTLKLSLREDSSGVSGAMFYDGPAVKALGVSKEIGRRCKASAMAANEGAMQAVEQVAQSFQAIDTLKELFEQLFKEEPSDSKDSSTGAAAGH